MSEYFDALHVAMNDLAKDSRTIFIGQAVSYAGTAMSRTLEAVPADQRVELPVAEDMQMGMAVGLSLQGLIPVCIYPRWNFLLLATNQLVNHLDKLPLYSKYQPKVIVRTAIGTDDPLDPGPQHLGDFSEAYRLMLRTVTLQTLKSVQDIRGYYHTVLNHDVGSTILVEDTSLY